MVRRCADHLEAGGQEGDRRPPEGLDAEVEDHSREDKQQEEEDNKINRQPCKSIRSFWRDRPFSAELSRAGESGECTLWFGFVVLMVNLTSG
jgi:hypothetical protein